jgi:5-methylcytosine-specific restriction endonuclease McrA
MSGEMSPELYEYVRGLLNNRVPNPHNCTVCGTIGSVSLAQHLVTPIVTSPQGGVQLGATQYPQAMLICTQCGNTSYHNYVILAAAAQHG